MFAQIITTPWHQLSAVHLLIAVIAITLLVFKTTREGITGKPRYRRGKRGNGYISNVSHKDWQDYSKWKKEQEQKKYPKNMTAATDPNYQAWEREEKRKERIKRDYSEMRKASDEAYSKFLASDEYKRQEARIKHYQEVDSKFQNSERDIGDYDDDEMLAWARKQDKSNEQTHYVSQRNIANNDFPREHPDNRIYPKDKELPF
jgi:hypothetical protein